MNRYGLIFNQISHNFVSVVSKTTLKFQVIGHEITHGFDDHGRQNDKDGNFVSWWTNSTVEKFKERTKCIIDQYSSFHVPLAEKISPNLTLNGVTTQVGYKSCCL